MDVPTGKSRSRSGVARSQSECGMCFQMPPGSSAFPFIKDIVWHPGPGRQLEVLSEKDMPAGARAGAGRGRSLTVMCNEVTR